MKSKSSTTLEMAAPPSKPRWTPHNYQLSAVKFLLSHGAAALFLDPGLGKTSIVLAALKYLFGAKTAQRALVVAPLRVCYLVWPAEAEKWKDFEGLRVEVLHGPGKDEALLRDADVYVINPEGLQWLATDGRFKKLKVDTLIVDESSKFKHTKTSRFKILKAWLPKFSRRWILTGTPAPNGLMDLFGQVFIMDLGKSLGQYITKFRLDYFDQFGFDYRIKEDGEARIQKALKPLVLRLRDVDHLDLPKLVFNDIWIDLPPNARKAYDEMENLLFTQMESGEALTAVSAGVAAMKCRQIVSGALYRDIEGRAQAKTKKEEWVEIHSAKTEALEDLIEELAGQPLLIAYEFQHDLQRIKDALGDKVTVLQGSMARVKELEAKWNAGEIAVLAGHAASIGHGLNLQRAGNHVGWFSLTWDLELYEQFIRRVRRQGNKHKCVFVHRFLARKTIDVAVASRLDSKAKVQGSLLEAFSTYRTGKR